MHVYSIYSSRCREPLDSSRLAGAYLWRVSPGASRTYAAALTKSRDFFALAVPTYLLPCCVPSLPRFERVFFSELPRFPSDRPGFSSSLGPTSRRKGDCFPPSGMTREGLERMFCLLFFSSSEFDAITSISIGDLLLFAPNTHVN